MKINKLLFILISFSLFISSCEQEKTEEDKLKQDSIIGVKKSDSIVKLKSENPLLIAPPNDDYSGDYIDKYDNGNTKFKGFYRFGKRHGQWMAFYANGTLWSECFYDKGLRHGANNVFFENGKARYKGWYKNDLRDSLWIFYDEQGKEIKKVKFKNDNEVSVN